MTLNLYDILQEVLLREAVDSDSVIDAIANQQQVIIKYEDEDSHAPGKRIIEPYVYGLTMAGHPCVRAYQYEGDTFRGKPKWKLFRLDRVTSWQPTDRHFNTSPAANGWPAEGYNEAGDNSMSSVLYQVHFDGDEHPDSLKAARAATERLRSSNPINISQMDEPNEAGAITNNGYNPVNQTNSYTQQTEPVIRGAIDLSKVQDTDKDKDYWKDYTKARKEKTQQNKKEKKKNYNNTYYFNRKADKKPLIKPHDEEEVDDTNTEQ